MVFNPKNLKILRVSAEGIRCIFILILAVCLSIVSVSAFSQLFQCAAPSTTGCSASGNAFQYYGACTAPPLGSTSYCGPIKAVNDYALVLTQNEGWAYWSSSNPNKKWGQISDPRACASTLGFSAMSSYTLVGFDKTTSSSRPFVALYAKWNSGTSKWDYAVVSFKAGSNWDGCSAWTINYHWEGSNGADFASTSHGSFSCIKEGVGPNGASGDQECWWGGNNAAGVFGAYGIQDAYGFGWNDPEPGRAHKVYEIQATDKVFAVSGPDNSNYVLGVLINAGTATGKIWMPTSLTSTGVHGWTDMVESSARIGNTYSDSYTTAPRFFVIGKEVGNSYQYAAYGLNTRNPYDWYPYIVDTAVKFNTGTGKFQNVKSNSMGSVYGEFGFYGSKSWGISAYNPGNKISTITSANWGSAGFTSNTCIGSSSDTSPRGFVDYSANGVGWAVRSASGTGCLIWSTQAPVNPPATCNCTPYVSTGVCGGQCGPSLTCGGAFVCKQRTCTPSLCEATYTCVQDAACGTRYVTCRDGAGTPGVKGQNWWSTAFIGTDTGSTSPCGTDTSPYPVYNATWGTPLTITTNTFHYLNYAAQVTISIKEIGSSAEAWTKTITVSGTSLTTGAVGLFSWPDLAAWQASPFCKKANYTVSVRAYFPGSVATGQIANYWVTNTFRLNVQAANTALPNGANCAACTCGPWNSYSCYGSVGGEAGANARCSLAQPLYQVRICNNGCDPGDGYTDWRCIASGVCTSIDHYVNQTIPDCGSNGCPEDSFSIYQQGVNVLGDPIGQPFYSCNSTTQCTEAGTCGDYYAQGCGFGGCSVAQMLYARTCVTRPGDLSPYFQVQYCVDNENCTVVIPSETPDYSYQFNMLPSDTVSLLQNDAQFRIDYQNNLVNTSYYVAWSYNVCLESDLNYCPFNNSGSFELGANSTQSVLKGVYWGTDIIQGVQQGQIYPGQYRIIFRTESLGTVVAHAQNYTWTVSASNLSVAMGAVSDVNWGSTLYLPVTLYDTNSRGLTLTFEFFRNGSKIQDYNPINTYASSPSGEAHVFNLSILADPFWPGSYGVRAKASVSYSGVEYAALSNISNFSIIGNLDQSIDLNITNPTPRWGQNAVTFTVTPRDNACNPTCKVATEVSLGFYEFNLDTQAYDINTFTVNPWSAVSSGTSKEFTINANTGASPRWDNLAGSGVGNQLQPGKTYLVLAKAVFDGIPVVTSQQMAVLAEVSIDQSGFTPIYVNVRGGSNPNPAYVSYGTVGSIAVSPVSYICASYSGIFGSSVCLTSDDLGIDVISGVAAVRTANPDLPEDTSAMALVYSGYQIMGNSQIDKVGIIDDIYIPLAGSTLQFSNPQIFTVSTPGVTGDSGCISNPIPAICPLERNVSIGIGVDSGSPNASQLFRGGSFAYIYYVGNDSWLQCAGTDGIQRMEPLKISSWTTAGVTTPLYYGDCMVRGGITGFDIDRDNFTEVIGGGGIVDMRRKTVGYKFGQDRAIVPVDVNSDGYIDFVSQEFGTMEVWPGTSQSIGQYSNTLAVSSISPCQVDSNGRLVAAIIAVGPGDAGAREYRMDYGDQTNEFHASSLAGTANQFIHSYTAKGTYVVTGTVYSGSNSANGTCTVVVTDVPNYYEFSGEVSNVCSIGTQGLFTTYSGSLASVGWKMDGSTFTSHANSGVVMSSNVPGEIYRSVMSTNSTQVLKIRFEPVNNYVFDVAYKARIINTNTVSEIGKIRVFDDKVYVVERGGMNRQIASIVDGNIYDLELVLDSVNRSVAVNFGEMGSTLQRVYDNGFMMVSNDFDLLSGEIRFSYAQGIGNLFIFDYACLGGAAANVTENMITQYFGNSAGNLALLNNCVEGEPGYFDYGNNTDSSTFFDDPNRVMYNHSIRTDSYPNVGDFCSRLPARYCTYNDLKYLEYRNVNCYKEIYNYCIGVTYLRESGQVGGVGDGGLACTMILGSSNLYQKTASPILKDFGQLLSDNWFEVAIVVIIILVAASFAGNKRRN